MADRYAVATGNWNATSTWSDTDGGAPGASAPVDGDTAYFNAAVTVTLTAHAACTGIVMTRGTIDADTFNMDIGAGGFTATTTTYARGIVMGSGTWTCAGDWKANWTNFTQTAENSTVVFDCAGDMDFYSGAQAFKNLRFSPGTFVRMLQTTSVTGTFTVSAGKTVYWGAGTTFTAATWVITGTVGSVITFAKVNSGTNPILAKSGGGVVEGYYLSISNTTASPVSTFYAYSSTDGGGNTAWTFIATQAGRQSVLSDKLLFIGQSALDTATISASSAVSGLPASNVQDTHIRKIHRAASYKQEWIKFDCGAATAVQGVFIGRHNFSEFAVVLWQGCNADIWTAPPLNVTMYPVTDSLGNPVNKMMSFWATAASYRYWRLYVNDKYKSSDLHTEVGRIFAGRTLQPDQNIRQDHTIEMVDPSIGVPLGGRTAYWIERTPYTRLSYQVTDVSCAVYDALRSIYATAGQSSAFVVATNPVTRPHHNTYYVQFATPLKSRHRVLTQYNVDAVIFEEKV